MSVKITADDDSRRREARRVRGWSVEAFHDSLVEAGVRRAFVAFENGRFTLSHPSLLAPVQAFFELSGDFAEHEAVFIGREDGIPTLFFAFVHDTRRGLAQGGLRFKPYASIADVFVDGLRLAQGMTRKNALAGLWWGGGKGIVPLTRGLDSPAYRTERTPERTALFQAYGRFVAGLGGVYYTAEDIGTKTSDLDAILGQNRFTTCISDVLGGSGNPSPHTARGVFRGMQAAWRHLTGTDDLAGVKVAVQGAGNVGAPLVDLLDDAGARVWLTDVDRAALAALAARRPRITVVEEPDAVFDLEVDVFAPCAIGAVVNARTIPRLEVRLVCGAANNILAEPADAERLRRRGIAFVPDFLCNRMGIVNCADEWRGYLEDDVRVAAEGVYPDTLRVLRHARGLQTTPSAAAEQLADVAACELHPLNGHRGRRLIDRLIQGDWAQTRAERPRGATTRKVATVAPAFDPAVDEPALRRREDRERGPVDGPAIAVAPLAAAGRPDLATLFPAVLLDVRARDLERRQGLRPRRVLGTDPGGLALQLAVERSLPTDREEIGRAAFVELCADAHRAHDAAVRGQLGELGVAFDHRRWLDPLDAQGREAVRRLYRAVGEAGLLRRERRLGWYDPAAQTVLVSNAVHRVEVEVGERWTLFFTAGDGRRIPAHTFAPELLAGAAALAVRTGGPWADLAGTAVADPLRPGETLPIVAVEGLGADAELLIPAHDRRDAELAQGLGLAVARPALDDRGRAVLPGEPPLGRDEARHRLVQRLGDALVREEGRFKVETWRSRTSDTVVELGESEQLFVHLEDAAPLLRRAIAEGEVLIPSRRARERVLAGLDALEPWCISRQYWWGHPLPDPAGGDGPEVLAASFSMVAATFRALGWPGERSPEPIAEVLADPDVLARWVVPSQLLALALTGRPAFRTVHVHGALHVVERTLARRPDAADDAVDEERFALRPSKRPMRRKLGNAVEPTTLVRRFGADALRLGYLLALPAGEGEVATASESVLQQGRRAIRRLISKVTGVFHLDEAPASPDRLPLADAWLLARLDAATGEAEGAFLEARLGAVALVFCRAVDDLARWSALATARRRAGDAAPLRPTAAAALARLRATFGALCPYVLDHLAVWTAARATALGDPVERPWLAELVARLDRGHAAITIGVADPEVRAWLTAEHAELARLVRREIAIVEGVDGGEAVGPCVVGR